MTNQNPPNEFQTRAGSCAIAPDEITFARRDDKARRGSSRTTLLYVGLASLMFGFGIYFLLQGDWVMGTILMFAGLAFPWLSLRSESGAVAPNIPRQAIRQVQAHAPHPPLTRGYFVVTHARDGKTQEQIIVVAGGADEYARALNAFRAAGLLSG